MNLSDFLPPALLFLLTLASGFWVSKIGKPYPTGIFTIHKLFSLAKVVFIVIKILDPLKNKPLPDLLALLIVLAGISVIALFATGALMSIQKNDARALLLIHRISPFLLAGSLGLAIWLLINQ